MVKKSEGGKRLWVASTLTSFHVTHRWASPAQLQAFAAQPAEAILRDVAALRGVRGCVALITCHRFEIYAETDPNPAWAPRIQAYFHGETFRTHVSEAPTAFRPRGAMRRLSGRRTLHHLHRVAAGLDSKLVGEKEILGQVRDALALAARQGTLSPQLRQAFNSAIAVGRMVRRLPGFDGRRRSLGIAIRARISATQAPILLVGAGRAARAVLAAAQSPQHFVITNRSIATARRLADSLGAKAVPLTSEALNVEWSAIVWAVPEAPQRMFQRPLRTNLFVDLRSDGHGAGGQVQAHRWVSLDEINQDARPLPPSTARRAERLVATEASRQWVAWRGASSETGAVVRRIHEAAGRIEDHEVGKALQRLAHLAPRDQDVVRDLARSLRMKLFLTPTLRLSRARGAKGAQAIAAAQRLFGLRNTSKRSGAAP